MGARLCRETLSHRTNFPPSLSLLTKNPTVNAILSRCCPYRALRATCLKPQCPGTPGHPFFLIFPFPPPVFSPLLFTINIKCSAQWSHSFLLKQELTFIQTNARTIVVTHMTLTCSLKLLLHVHIETTQKQIFQPNPWRDRKLELMMLFIQKYLPY